MTRNVKRENYLGGNSFIANIIYHHRYIYILYFTSIFILNKIFLDGYKNDTILIVFILISLTYFIYNIVLHVYKIREKHQSLIYRQVRVNIDLFYFTASLFLIGNIAYAFSIIYFIPLLTSINFRKNRHYAICSLWICFYFLILQLLYKTFYQADFNKVLIDIAIFLFFLIIFTGLFYVFNESFEDKDKELEKIRGFIQRVRYSVNYREALNSLIAELQRLIDVPIITVMLYDHQKNELFIAESVGINERQKSLRLKPGQGVCGNSFQDEEIKLVRDTTNKGNNCGYISFQDLAKPVFSELCFPLVLRANSKPIGVLNFESYEKNYFKEEMVYMLNTLMHHIVFILEKSYEDSEYNLKLRRMIASYRENVYYLRDVAHEWRNKLNAFIQIPDYVLNKEGRDINIIKDLAKTQEKESETVIVSLNKALEGKSIYKPSLKRELILNIIHKINNDNYYLFRIRNIDLNISGTFNDQTEIETDLEWISDILNNLIINSINAYNKIGESRGSINLEIIDEKSYIKFILVDCAGGLDERLLKKLCDPSAPIVKEGRVGLTIVKKYTNLLGGKIDGQIIPNPRGTRITLTFPTIIKDKE